MQVLIRGAPSSLSLSFQRHGCRIIIPFWYVVEHYDVVEAISNVQTDFRDKPVEPVVLEHVRIEENKIFILKAVLLQWHLWSTAFVYVTMMGTSSFL